MTFPQKWPSAWRPHLRDVRAGGKFPRACPLPHCNPAGAAFKRINVIVLMRKRIAVFATDFPGKQGFSSERFRTA
jgi:hypothetical protein